MTVFIEFQKKMLSTKADIAATLMRDLIAFCGNPRAFDAIEDFVDPYSREFNLIFIY